MHYIIVILSLAFLLLGSEIFVYGAVKLADRFKISPWIVGLIIIGIGTSMPELVVSVIAAIDDNHDEAIGSVVGSNVFNILFILGIIALVFTIPINTKRAWVDLPFLICSSIMLWFFGKDNQISKLDGMIFISVFFLYILSHLILENKLAVSSTLIIISNKKEKIDDYKVLFKNSIVLIIGLSIMVIAANSFVAGATVVARNLGFDDFFIGITVFAIGTSLPELLSSFSAMKKGHSDMAVASILGSNIFNLLFILGFSSLLGKKGLELDSQFQILDMPVIIFISIIIVPLYYKKKITRWQGFIGIFLYICYLFLSIKFN